MSNLRKAIYNHDKTQIGIKAGKERVWFPKDQILQTKTPGIYSKEIKGKNYYFGSPSDIQAGALETSKQLDKSNIARNLPPISFPRRKTDLALWRQGIWEAERLPFQFRVYMQTLLMDVPLDPFIRACWERRLRLTLKKTPVIFDENDQPIKKQPKFLKSMWWRKLSTFILQAQGYGYQLISMGDMVNGTFPDIDIIPRQNISPDREVVATVVYSVGGKYFGAKKDNEMDIKSSVNPDTGEPYYNSHIWVTTPTEIGGHFSKCGYGLFYYLAPFYFALRDTLQFNLDFLQLCIEPIRHMKTNKTDDKVRQELFDSLLQMGRSFSILTDKDDELDIKASGGSGNGYMAFADMELRAKKIVSVLLLGHEDVESSVPGKLGSQQKGSGGETPQQQAMMEIESEQDNWFCDIINNNVFPKLKEMGFDVPDGTYGYEHNEQLTAEADAENKQSLVFAQILQALKQAGYTVPPEYIEAQTGIPVEVAQVTVKDNIPEPGDEIQDVTNFLKGLEKSYGHSHK
jgi:hypothetical protein